MSNIANIQAEIVSDFAKFANWEDKYKHLMDMGKAIPAYPEEQRQDKYKVKGCQSQVWVYPDFDGTKIVYHVDSDAMIVKGLAAILQRTFSGHTPAEIAAAPMDFLQEIGLTSHLSQSRSNGLAAMVRQFKNYALVYEMMKKSQVSK